MASAIESLPNTGSSQQPPPPNPPSRNFQISNENMNTIVNDIQQSGMKNIPLPPRHMPNDSSQHITKDEEARVNYVKKEPQDDYIKEYDNLEEIQRNAQKKEAINNYDEYLPYGFAAILYVLLQMPQVRDLVKKNIPGLFNSEGAPLMSYNVVLAIVFAGGLYASQKYILKFD